MIAARLPRNESERLAALLDSRILDSEQEEDFDALTRLAAHICETPIAAVSLIDDHRQWFKSKVGLDVSETPRDVAFCAHTILESECLVVPDAADDDRFATNPLVTGDPHIRFYAGIPLETSDGFSLGALCVIDRKPRELTTAQRDALDVLSRHASQLLDGRRRQMELIATQQRFQALADAADEGVAIVREGRITEVNRALCKLTGRSRASLLGLEPSALVSPKERARVSEKVQQRAEEDSISYESEVVRSDGTVVPVSVTAKTVLHGGSEVRVSVIRDLSKERHAERTQREFISVVSHELRTPLTSIHGSLRLLASGALVQLDGRAKQLVEIAAANAERLIQLTNDLLDVDRADADRLALTLDEHRIRDLIGGAVESAEGMALDDSVTIDVHEGAALDTVVLVDRRRIRQVLTNLLSNAIKYSNPGTQVEVRACAAEGRVRVEVLDRGPGVPEADRERIFERFRQARGADAARGGTGLGLAVARALATQHGGEVGMEPREGGGSIFWLELLTDG